MMITYTVLFLFSNITNPALIVQYIIPQLIKYIDNLG